MPEHATHQQEFNIREYWHVLVRRRWMIYTAVLVATVAAAVSSFVATPTYRSTTTISIERTGVRLLKQDLMSAEPSWLDYQNFYNTQYRIIDSDAVLRLAVDALNLRTRGLPGAKTGSSSLLSQFKDQLTRVVSRTSVPEAQEDEYYPLIKFLRAGVSVDPVRDSHLVAISFVSSDRNFAAQAANAIAESYTQFTLMSKLDLAKQSEKFFVAQIAKVREEIQQGEKGLQDFGRQHGFVTGDTNQAALKNYEELGIRYTKAQGDLAEASGKYRAYQQAAPESLQEVRESPLIQQLSSAAAEAEREYKEKVATYGSEYPAVVTARSKMEATREKLNEQRAAIARQAIESARTDYLAKQRQAEELQHLLEGSKASADSFQGPYTEYLTRKRVVESKQATLNELLAKQNDMELSARLGETGHNVRVIDEAQPARQIFKPKKKLNITLGFLFGLLIGVGAAVLAEYIDNTLKTPDDVRNTLGLVVIGMIPSQADDGAHETRRVSLRRSAAETRKRDASPTTEHGTDPALITLQAPLSPVSEAYRELRTALLLSMPGHPIRDVTVTSCQPGEGKTTTAVNLAIALGQLGRRVLIVDTDLRRPRCHQVLRVNSARGVSTYLTGNSDLSSLMVPTHAERVWLLPAGPIPPNPAELLDAERFRDLVAQLRRSADIDHVIFDSPPVLSVVDPLLIGRQTEGTILVVKSGFTSRESGRLGKEKLASGRLNLIGVVLNAVTTEHVPYQYRYYRYGYSRENADDIGSGEHREADGEHVGADGGRRA